MGKDRRARALVALVALGLLATACGNGGTELSAQSSVTDDAPPSTAAPAEGEAPAVGGSLVVGLSGETPSYLPGAATLAAPGFHVALALFDPLAARAADGRIHPFAAKSIEPSGDASEWTVTLRDGIVFHDGTALTADVMRQIFEDYLTSDTSTLSGDLAQVTELRVDDELTFTYVLDAPNAAFDDLLTGPVGWPFS